MPNLAIISRSLLLRAVDRSVCRLDKEDVVPDRTTSAQVATRTAGLDGPLDGRYAVALLTAFLMRVISLSIVVLVSWCSSLRIFCEDGWSLYFLAKVIMLPRNASRSWSGSFFRCLLSYSSNVVASAYDLSDVLDIVCKLEAQCRPVSLICHDFWVSGGSQKLRQ